VYPKNHSIIIGDHLVQLSVLCRELIAAEEIRTEYFAHLCRALETQFLPDGVQNELSTSYHIVCYMRLTEATSLCELAGVPVPAEITAWRRRILTAAAYYLFPNGQIAAFNDGHMGTATDTIGDGDLEVRALYPSAIATTIACGQHEPFACWMPHGLYGQQPCPRLTMQLNEELPCCLLTLLAPFRAAEEMPPHSSTRDVRAAHSRDHAWRADSDVSMQPRSA
jgi:hypothetical protein